MTPTWIVGLTLLAACSKPSAPCAPACVAAKLVDAGCAAPSSTLVQSVTSELDAGSVPAWATCLENGGTVVGCSVPCDATTVTVTRP